jgi:hypothetical protein
MDGDIARYCSHLSALISMVTWAFAASGRSEIANAVLINRSFILLVLLDAAQFAYDAAHSDRSAGDGGL